MRTKPIIGQIVYSLNVGKAAGNTTQELTEETVIKVGRKYFTTKRAGFETEYHLEDWREKSGEYIASWVLYESVKERDDERDGADMSFRIGKAFAVHSSLPKDVTLDQVKRISAILDEADNPTPATE